MNGKSFYEVYDKATRENVIEFLVTGATNPNSIRNCIEIARTNARAVRTALTSEMWEIINEAWLKIQKFSPSDIRGNDLGRFLSFIKDMSLQFDGAAYRTMLRTDHYYFQRLGMLIERADNTARLLDVKYHVLLPDTEPVGGGLDYFQWTSLLRSVSGLTSFHWVYRETVKPWLVADFLILRPEQPRSLVSVYASINQFLNMLAENYGRQGASQRISRGTYASLQNTKIDDLFQSGLHEFLSGFIADNNRLGGTSFHYEQPAQSAIQILRLTPRNDECQFVKHWRVEVDADYRLYRDEDPFGNITHIFSIEGPIETLRVLVEGEVETHNTNGIIKGTAERLPMSLWLRETWLTHADQAIRMFALRLAAGEGGAVLPFLHALNEAVFHKIKGETKQKAPLRTASEAFAAKTGQAEDLAQIFVSACNAVKIPSRIISGYCLNPEIEAEDKSHSWAEAYVAGLGWIGFDPTYKTCTTDHYIRVACGLDIMDAAPIRGSKVGGSDGRVDVDVQISAGHMLVEE
eukprot:gene10117-10184_t